MQFCTVMMAMQYVALVYIKERGSIIGKEKDINNQESMIYFDTKFIITGRY